MSTAPQSPVPFTIGGARVAAAECLSTAGLEGRPSLLRMATGAVFGTAEHVIRVADPQLGTRRPELELRLAPQLLAAGIATPGAVLPAPFVHVGGVVTVWERITHTGAIAGPHEVGQLAARLAAAAPVGVALTDPLDKTEHFLHQAVAAGTLSPGHLDRLLTLAADLRA